MSQKLQLLSDISQGLNTYLDAQPERVKFVTLRIPTASAQGIPLGNGACRGVWFKINDIPLNSITGAVPITDRLFYVGDSDGQFLQIQQALLPYFYACRDLSEIYVRNGLASTVAVIQVVVLLGRRDQVEVNPDLLQF